MENGDSLDQTKRIENTIAQLKIRYGSYGVERQKLMNNLFKSIVELSFPNMAKYLFWACDQNQGIFEPLNEEDFFKYKRMSKYKKDEIAANKQTS